MTEAIKNKRKRKWKLCAGILLLCAVFGVSIYYGTTVSKAATITVGTVATNSSPLTVRSGPGTNYEKIGSLAKGSQVTIVGEEKDWYRILYGNGEGYVSKTYISNVHTVEQNPPDEGYVKWLTDQGFPYSYAEKLAELHSKYPNWVFEPVMTGLDWKEVIAEESVLSVNMVPVNSNDAQKSTVSGAYNWADNTWTILDGSSWVAASSAMISYCMDPRNFLDETHIYQFETLQYAAYQSEANVKNVLASTFMSGTLRDDNSRTYAATFMEAGKSANVNPIHLATRCRQEQGLSGTSPLISGTYPGYEGFYNYFNIGAYGTPVSVLYERGLKEAKEKGWNSVYKAIVGGSSDVAKRYINLGQNTLYFQKFNVVNAYSGIYRHQYMANVLAAINEGKTMGNSYTDKTQAFVFRIPVYNNMPETVCALPTGGNPNNWLKSLSVSGYNITPGFDGAKTEYSLIVSPETSIVTVSAEAVVSTSKIQGTGKINLDYGNNEVKVICTAQNGSAREYVINIVRQEPEKPSVNKGDVNGDGEITLLDMLKIKRHLLGIEILENEKFEAADVNGDGTISLLDMLKIKRHLLGIEIIQ